jgi:Ni/Fe-hydrogenase subunit HybB-like protein
MASEVMRAPASLRLALQEKVLLGMTPGAYLRSLVTPGNLLAAAVLAIGIPVIVYRFVHGLGSVTNLTQVNAWGLWKGFNVITGVALGAGGYTLACAVYILGLREYRPVVRVGVLAGFVGYLFAVIGLLIDIGQPWRIPYPLVYSFGVTSVMFEVAWCMCLYLAVLLFELSPAVFEWLGLRRLRETTVRLSVGFVAFGVILSSLHQPSLGALFLMAPSKLHPLWYSRFLPILFFISSIAAGLCMVIVVSTVARRLMPGAFSAALLHGLDHITIGLGRGTALVLFGYLFLHLQALAEGAKWALLGTGWGAWYLLELIGFVAAPCAVLAVAAHESRVGLLRLGAGWALLGIVLNRMNVSVIALNWNVSERYVPSWQEAAVSLTLVTCAILAFRWIAYRMPVFREHADFPGAH